MWRTPDDGSREPAITYYPRLSMTSIWVAIALDLLGTMARDDETAAEALDRLKSAARAVELDLPGIAGCATSIIGRPDWEQLGSARETASPRCRLPWCSSCDRIGCPLQLTLEQEREQARLIASRLSNAAAMARVLEDGLAVEIRRRRGVM